MGYSPADIILVFDCAALVPRAISLARVRDRERGPPPSNQTKRDREREREKDTRFVTALLRYNFATGTANAVASAQL